MKNAILFSLIGLNLAGCIRSQKEFDHILRLEDRRTSCDSLTSYLESSEPKIRARAVEAMGKLQDPNCFDSLVAMLNDLNHNVRLHAAFALGQLGNSEAEATLTNGLTAKELTRVKTRILEALGKVGTENSFPVFIKYLKSLKSDLRAEAALSLGRMALRNLTDKAATDSLTILLSDGDKEVRWKACFSLMRIGEDLNGKRLVDALSDEDARVRMYAARAFGKTKDPIALEPLGKVINNDPDWRVRVNAANALANHPLSLVANDYSLLNQDAKVRTAIIRAIGASAKLEPEGYRQNSREHNFAKHQLEQIFMSENQDNQWSDIEIGLALISYGQLIGKDAIDLILKFKIHSNPRVRIRAITALGETGSPTIIRIFEKEYPDAPTVVKIAILQALDKVKKYSNPKLLLQALGENDAVLVAIAAKSLSQDTLKNRIYAQRIVQAYQGLPKPVDNESAKMIIQAIGVLGGKKAVPVLEEALMISDKALSLAAADALSRITEIDYSDSTVVFTKPHSDFNYKEVLKLANASALLKTSRGNIELEFFSEDAPLTVLNFVELAEKGFFDNLTFHRVVPNFVIQGGDPRGDGWGSPGYSIRSEFNMRPYLRGTVGMASAGKDTESCQFFITHSSQPHLDGRYTVFGRVTSGMEVVDAIQEGDLIELVVIRR